MARKVATLIKQQGDAYSAVGQRSEVRVYFNGGTIPGDNNRVYMEWTDESIQSPYRAGDGVKSPQEANKFGAEARDLIIGSRIEFFEMMTPDKMQDS
jgi:hypothetical protein